MKPSYLLLLLITVVSGAAPPSAPFYIQSKANGLFVVIDASSKILSAISSSSNYAGVFNYVPSSYLTDHKTGLFVSAESDGASALVANRQSNGIWETFTFAQSGNFWTILASGSDGQLVAIQPGNNQLLANVAPSSTPPDSALFSFVVAPSPLPVFSLPLEFNARDFGATGDGVTDDTNAIQNALSLVAGVGGGVLQIPAGTYAIQGTLSIPQAVTLKGSFTTPPSHPGSNQPNYGTVLLAFAGQGSTNGTAFITINQDATLSGVTGQPLFIGLYLDAIYDIGRVEDIHWNPWFSTETTLMNWQMTNGRAFVFGRSDWEYVFNTFAFGYNIGYHFIQTDAGACNGNFLGIGADDMYTAVQVDAASGFGLLITNGEFTSFTGPDPTEVVTGQQFNGKVQFENTAFWGPGHQIAKIYGSGTVGFSGCTFVQWNGDNTGRAAIQVYNTSSVILQGNEFQQDAPQVFLDRHVRRAVISGNLITGTVRITNNVQGGNVQIVGNSNA